MFREFFVRQIGLYKAPIKPHYISPIPMKNSSKNKISLKKDNTDNISISKIRNFGLVTYTNKNLRNNVLNSRYTSKSSLKTQTNSSKYFLTTSSTFNNLENLTKKDNQNKGNKNCLLKKKNILQNKIIKLKSEKVSLLKEKEKINEEKNKIKCLKEDINKLDLLINNCKKDYNDLSFQYINLKKQIEKIQKNEKI